MIDLLTVIFILTVIVIHIYIIVLEMVLWQTPKARKAFATSKEFAKDSAPLAANQGLYNGFLAAGLIWGLLANDTTQTSILAFFLSCIIIAGIYGAVTVNKRILFIQALPAAIALTLVLL